MASLRRRLRLWAVAWLVFQAASLAAFVPRSCCAAHDHAARHEEPSCHEAPPAEACPMEATDGAACPMHQSAVASPGHAGHEGAVPQDDARCCVMRGTCDGPPLFTLLAQPGVLDGPAAGLAPGAVVWLVPQARELLASLAVAPDPPPPRS